MRFVAIASSLTESDSSYLRPLGAGNRRSRFRGIERWFTDLGLEHVFEFRDKESSPIVSVWRGGSRLYIAPLRQLGHRIKPSCWRIHTERAPQRVSVTTNWLMAYFPVRTESLAPARHVVRVATAVSDRLRQRSGSRPVTRSRIRFRWKTIWQNWNPLTRIIANLIGDGFCISDGPDQYRPSSKWSLLVAANYTPRSLASRSRIVQSNGNGTSTACDLLPAGFYDADWIIPVVQDRVRTGSTRR